jgi:hypothetical protein
VRGHAGRSGCWFAESALPPQLGAVSDFVKRAPSLDKLLRGDPVIAALGAS